MPNQILNGEISHDFLPTDMACFYDRQLIWMTSKINHGVHLRHCYHHICPGMYKCYKSYCIPYRYICDGIPDCPQGEEEEECYSLHCPGLLKCKIDNICLARHEVCDGITHCSNSLDDEDLCTLAACPEKCLCYGLALDCSGQNKEKIPEYDIATRAIQFSKNHINMRTSLVWPHLLHFSITMNGIIDIYPYQFINCTSLTYLDLSRDGITYLHPKTFHGLKDLTQLVLLHNSIQRLFPFSFYGLIKLSKIDMNNQNIHAIHSNTFEGLTTLSVLNISFNNITFLSKYSFFSLPKLTILDLMRNKILTVEGKVWFSSTDLLLKCESECFCSFITQNIQCTFNVELKVKRCYLSIFPLRVIGSLLASIIITVNILGFSLQITINTKLKQNLIKLHMYLHLTDMLVAVFIFILIAFDTTYREHSILYEEEWLDSSACKSCGFLSAMPLSTSILTLFIRNIQRFIAVCYPFHMQQIMDKYVVPFHLYWMLSLATSIVRVIFLTPRNASCLHFSSFHPAKAPLITTVVCFTLEMAAFIGTLFLSVSSFVVIWKSRCDSGSKLSRSDIVTMVRTFLLIGINFLIWFLVVIDAIVNAATKGTPEWMMSWFSLVLLPLNAICNPLMHTFADKQFMIGMSKLLTKECPS